MTGKRLLALRHRLGATQAQLAARLGVAPNTVARWERGELTMRPSMEKLINLIAQADVTTSKEGKKS